MYSIMIPTGNSIRREKKCVGILSVVIDRIRFSLVHVVSAAATEGPD